jgi:release factor glutamine methyltransferase
LGPAVTGDTLGAALAVAFRRLRDAGSPTPRLDAEVLLAHVAGRDRVWLLAHPEAPLSEPDRFNGLVERRASGEPVAYIRGFKEWHGLRIRTDPRALIPRPETELLADAAVAEIAARLESGPVVAWDVGTGSGAVAIVIGLRHAEAVAAGGLRLIASDISTDALDLATANLLEHRVAGVEVLCGDLLEAADAGAPRPDVVVANLPYVSSSEVDERRGSLGFEPRVALDGGSDGIDQLRRLLSELPRRSAAGSTAFLEIGVGQAPVVDALAPPGAAVEIVPDLAGLDRVVRIQMPTLDR